MYICAHTYASNYIYAIKYYSPIKKKKILSSVKNGWTVGHYKSDRERQVLHYLLNVESKKLKTKQNRTPNS